MDRQISFRHEETSLEAGSLIAIQLSGQTKPTTVADWLFSPHPAQERDVLGLGKGQVCVESASNDGMSLTREVFRSSINPVLACRLILKNDSSEPLSVVSLIPIDIGPRGLKLGNSRAGQWAYMRQPRHKNDMPASIILGSAEPGTWDAVRGQKETGGLKRKDPDEKPPLKFGSSELMAVRCGYASAVFGVLPFDQQLIQNVLELTPDRQDLAGLRVEMECDKQWVPPGGQIVSQWVVIDFDSDTFAAIDRYVEAIKAVHLPIRPKRVVRPRPTVWCSWYYYGDGFTQVEAEENLAALEKRRLPFDVFLIDQCWDRRSSDWYPNADWPNMKALVRRVKKLKYIPGIWISPSLVEPRAKLQYHHPEWLIRTANGKNLLFEMYPVLDPTHPEANAFVEGVFRRLKEEYGFRYFKIDFLRSVTMPGAIYHNRTKNRAQAYRMAVEAIRRGIGEECYLSICGGMYGPSIGLTDAQRSGSDVKSFWPDAPVGEEAFGYGPFTIKQNTLRYWMNELWDNDPDSLMVRRRPEPYKMRSLSLGTMNDGEALTSTLNQYLGGGMICTTENLAEVEDDRLFLLRHCAPSIGSAGRPRDWAQGVRFPAIFDTIVNPRAKKLKPWHTVSLANWFNDPRTFKIRFDRELLAEFADSAQRFCVSAFLGKWSKIVEAGATIEVGPIAPHCCEVIKVQALETAKPSLVRTDGHFSMGGTELTAWQVDKDGLKVAVDWPWPVSLDLVIAPPEGRRFADASADGTRTVTIDGKVGAKHTATIKYA
jgi:hypothetical protein